MNTDLTKAMNRLARAIERQNNPKVQRTIVQVKMQEILKQIEDAATVKRVTNALRDIVPNTYEAPAAFPSQMTPAFQPNQMTEEIIKQYEKGFTRSGVL